MKAFLRLSFLYEFYQTRKPNGLHYSSYTRPYLKYLGFNFHTKYAKAEGRKPNSVLYNHTNTYSALQGRSAGQGRSRQGPTPFVPQPGMMGRRERSMHEPTPFVHMMVGQGGLLGPVCPPAPIQPIYPTEPIGPIFPPEPIFPPRTIGPICPPPKADHDPAMSQAPFLINILNSESGNRLMDKAYSNQGPNCPGRLRCSQCGPTCFGGPIRQNFGTHGVSVQALKSLQQLKVSKFLKI